VPKRLFARASALDGDIASEAGRGILICRVGSPSGRSRTFRSRFRLGNCQGNRSKDEKTSCRQGQTQSGDEPVSASQIDTHERYPLLSSKMRSGNAVSRHGFHEPMSILVLVTGRPWALPTGGRLGGAQRSWPSDRLRDAASFEHTETNVQNFIAPREDRAGPLRQLASMPMVRRLTTKRIQTVSRNSPSPAANMVATALS
jgi:hypothetical protein